MMSTKAKWYAYSLIASGGLAFGLALWNWASPNPLRFIIYFTLALIASTLKVRLPRITGTYSVSFLFTLVGIVEFTLPETLVASCARADAERDRKDRGQREGAIARKTTESVAQILA